MHLLPCDVSDLQTSEKMKENVQAVNSEYTITSVEVNSRT